MKAEDSTVEVTLGPENFRLEAGTEPDELSDGLLQLRVITRF